MLAKRCKQTKQIVSYACNAYSNSIFLTFDLFYSFLVGEDEPMDTTPDEVNGDQQTPAEPYEEWRERTIAKAKEIIKAAKVH